MPPQAPLAGRCQPRLHFSGLRNSSPSAFMGSAGAGEEPGGGRIRPPWCPGAPSGGGSRVTTPPSLHAPPLLTPCLSFPSWGCLRHPDGNQSGHILPSSQPCDGHHCRKTPKNRGIVKETPNFGVRRRCVPPPPPSPGPGQDAAASPRPPVAPGLIPDVSPGDRAGSWQPAGPRHCPAAPQPRGSPARPPKSSRSPFTLRV